MRHVVDKNIDKNNSYVIL